MLIVCTQDPAIASWAQNPKSNSGSWQNVFCLTAGQNQTQATNQLKGHLANLSQTEPLCLSAHGNDTEIGDEGSGLSDWGWTTADIAQYLADKCPKNKGPMLMSVCCKTVANFSAGLATKLGKIPALKGVWIYGYNKSVPVTQTFTAPSQMGNMVDLQGTQV